MRLALLVLLLTGCDARYGPGSDVERGLVVDASSQGSIDLGSPVRVDAGGADLAQETGTSAVETLGEGTFSGRQGHAGSGGATLVRDASGVDRVVLGDDFVVTDVPGPVVLLTTRTTIGTSITSEDAQLGVLASATGTSTYAVPGGSQCRRNVFMYCKPFGTEVAFAPLSP